MTGAYRKATRAACARHGHVGHLSAVLGRRYCPLCAVWLDHAITATDPAGEPATAPPTALPAPEHQDHVLKIEINEYASDRKVMIGEVWTVDCSCGWAEYGTEHYVRKTGYHHVRQSSLTGTPSRVLGNQVAAL